MSIWTRISEALSALANGESLSAVFEKLRTPSERSVGFAIAVIALGAKMAKADGRVTRAEVRAFREVFHIAPEDEARAAQATASHALALATCAALSKSPEVATDDSMVERLPLFAAAMARKGRYAALPCAAPSARSRRPAVIARTTAAIRFGPDQYFSKFVSK